MVDDESEALGPGGGVPADPSVAVFEMESWRAPEEQADPLLVLFRELVKAVAGGEARTQRVFGLQQGAKALAFDRVSEQAHGQRAGDVRFGGGGASRFDPKLQCAGQGQMLSRERNSSFHRHSLPRRSFPCPAQGLAR